VSITSDLNIIKEESSGDPSLMESPVPSLKSEKIEPIVVPDRVLPLLAEISDENLLSEFVKEFQATTVDPRIFFECVDAYDSKFV
jgi:hypothetical protein